MTFSCPDQSELRFFSLWTISTKPGSVFTWTISHTSQQGQGHEAAHGTRSLSRAVTLWSCPLPPSCRDGLVCRRTGVHGAWLPSQAPLLPRSSSQTRQICKTLEEWPIIYLGFPSSLTLEFACQLKNNLNILFLSFLSVWGEWVCEICLWYIKQNFFFLLAFQWSHFKLKHD